MAIVNWIKTLKPFRDEYIKLNFNYSKKIARLSKKMTKFFNDGYEYEVFESEYGWFFGRVKDGNRKVLTHDSEFDDIP